MTVGAFEYASSKHHDRAMPLSVEYSNWACNQVIRNSTGLASMFTICFGSNCRIRKTSNRTLNDRRAASMASSPQRLLRVLCGDGRMGSDRFASAWRLATTRTYPMCLPESSESESISNWLSGGTEPQVGRPNLDAKFTVEKDRRQSPPATEVQHTHPIRSVVMSICQSIFIYRNMVSRTEESQWTERQSSRDLEWYGPVPGSSRRSVTATFCEEVTHGSAFL